MLTIQVLILLFCVFSLIATWRRSSEGKITRLAAATWSSLWVAVGVAALQPEVTTLLAKWVGVGRGVDLVIYLALLGIFFLLFRLYTRLEETEREITRLVRTLALERAGIEEDDESTSPSPGSSD